MCDVECIDLLVQYRISSVAVLVWR